MSSRLPAGERRQQLLDTALTTFARQGYNDASMNDIAEAAGVTKPVLYQHFSSKRDLFLELLTDLADRLSRVVHDAAAKADGPRRQVEDGFVAWFEWVDQNRDGFTVLFDSEVRRDPEFAESLARAQRQLADSVAEFVRIDGVDLPPERRRLLAYGIVGVGESACRRWLDKDIDLDADELGRQVASIAWYGLRGLAP